MSMKNHLKGSLSRTFYILMSNKLKFIFFAVMSLFLQFQVYSLEYKAKITGGVEDIAQAVASGAVFLSVEILLGLIFFSVVAGGMLKKVLGRKPLMGTSMITFGGLSSLVVALSVSVVFLGALFQLTHDGADSMTAIEQQEAAVRFLAFSLPIIMGIPYAISALVMSQLTLNTALKVSNKHLRNKEIKALDGYKNSFIAFFVSWKHVFTRPFFMIYAILFVLFVSPELYLPESIKGTLIPVVMGVIGHVMVLVMYLAAIDDGLVRYLEEDASDEPNAIKV
jgi:hypothetical protein